MLLRRVMSHVRDQNWTAVAIDFVIVVIGVYVGIEVANWNERRVELERGQEYLERIEADLAYNIQSLGLRRAYWIEVAEEGRRALAFAEAGELAEDSAWVTLRAFLHASQVWRFTFNDTTYSEMRSAGELNLLESPVLRSDLAEYFVSRAPRRGEGFYLLFPAYRETVRSAFPSTLARYYWEACHDQAREVQELRACEAPVDEAEARRALDELVGTPGLLGELRYWINTLDLLIELADIDLELSRQLADEVAASKR